MTRFLPGKPKIPQQEKDVQHENAPVEEPPAKIIKWQQAAHIV